MKRVLLIEPCFENYGGYYRAFGMARGLALQGFDVTLLLSSRGPWTFRVERKRIGENLAIVKLPRLQLNPWLTGRFLRAFMGLAYALFGRFDVIHVFTIVQFEALIPFLFLRIVTPWKKVILDWDDYWTESHTQHASPNPYELAPVRWYMKFCEYRIQRLARHMTVTSRFFIGEARKLGIPHCLKIINGVDLKQCVEMDRMEARRRLGIAGEDKIFLSFGNSFHHERTRLLFEVFGEICKRDPGSTLLINIDPDELWGKYGRAPLDPAVRARIKNVGYLAGETLSNHLGACDAVLFMMSDNHSEAACFPTRIGTYLCGGRIVVMNDVPTEACETLKEQKVDIIASSPAELAERVLEVIRDPARKVELEAASRRARQALSWESLSVQLAEFYREVVV